jgi:hypothetical protein
LDLDPLSQPREAFPNFTTVHVEQTLDRWLLQECPERRRERLKMFKLVMIWIMKPFKGPIWRPFFCLIFISIANLVDAWWAYVLISLPVAILIYDFYQTEIPKLEKLLKNDFGKKRDK